jgi:hypothetical protein
MRVSEAHAIADAIRDGETVPFNIVPTWAEALYTLAHAADSERNMAAYDVIRDHINGQTREAVGADWASPYLDVRHAH